MDAVRDYLVTNGRYFLWVAVVLLAASGTVASDLTSESFAQRRCILKGHTDEVTAVAFSPDGKRLVSGGWDQTVRVWDVATGRMLQALYGHTDAVWSVAYAPLSGVIVSGGADQVRLWDADAGFQKTLLRGPADQVRGVAVAPDGHALAAAGADGTVKVFGLTPLGSAAPAMASEPAPLPDPHTLP